METTELNEVLACLPKGKTHYRYYKDAYAPQILSMAIDKESDVRTIQQSSYAKLLKTPAVKAWMAKKGSGALTALELNSIWQEPSLPYLLTASRWKFESRRWSQVSRKGDNLVLQLNLPREHDELFDVSIGKRYSFNPSWGHPVQQKFRNPRFRSTLAWARIDLSFENNEALIEEVQSDGVRLVNRVKKRQQRVKCNCAQCALNKRYMQWFDSYSLVWSETMLMATIDFIRTELGIERVFFHTARSGWRVKKIDKSWRPPVSLYSSLPKKFAFTHVWNAPQFLLDTKSYHKLVRQHPDIDFYMLDFSKKLGVGKRQQRGKQNAVNH